MNISTRKKGKSIMAGILSMLVLVLFVAPYQLTANSCVDALEDCMVDVLVVSAVAFIAGLAGGAVAGALTAAGAVAGSYSAFCLAGYAFCMNYVIN
jgi:hypothetical protein